MQLHRTYFSSIAFGIQIQHKPPSCTMDSHFSKVSCYAKEELGTVYPQHPRRSFPPETGLRWECKIQEHFHSPCEGQHRDRGPSGLISQQSWSSLELFGEVSVIYIKAKTTTVLVKTDSKKKELLENIPFKRPLFWLHGYNSEVHLCLQLDCSQIIFHISPCKQCILYQPGVQELYKILIKWLFLLYTFQISSSRSLKKANRLIGIKVLLHF